MSLLSGLDDGWEIALLAATFPQQRIRGLVRANKALARLQREGFPVEIRFRNIQKGPASQDLLPRAEAAQAKGYLRIEEVRMRKEGLDDRTDFTLTEDGSRYVQTVVLPKMKAHPRSDLLFLSLRRALEECKHLPTTALVSEAHATLHLDDRAQLLGAFHQTDNILRARYVAVEAAGRPTSMFDLTHGAVVELACDALAAIRPALEDPQDRSTGKNHVLALCEDLVDVLDERDRLEPLGMGAQVAEDLDRILNALEVNCTIYDILHIITDEEVAQMMREVPPLDPRTGHD